MTSKHFNRETGTLGEKLAWEYLLAEYPNLNLLERNFTCKLGEIDLVVEHGKELIFVEVKTRRNLNYGFPYEAVTRVKSARIRRIAEYYMMLHHREEYQARFDVVAVYLGNGSESPQFEHLMDAF